MEHFNHATAFADPLSVSGVEHRTPMQTVRAILPFLWPQQPPGMRARVVIAITCLLLGRAANVCGPIVLKHLIDGLDGVLTAATGPSALFGLALLYGLTVLLPGAMTEIRVAVFTPVSEFAQRTIGLKAFKHLHNLSMSFHLDRLTGGLSRAIERGTRALQQIIGLFAFNIAPTLFEIGMVCIYLAIAYPAKYVAVILLALAGYIAFTLLFTEWRTRFRGRW